MTREQKVSNWFYFQKSLRTSVTQSNLSSLKTQLAYIHSIHSAIVLEINRNLYTYYCFLVVSSPSKLEPPLEYILTSQYVNLAA